MRKERKVNIIRALKDELSFYKRQPVLYETVFKTNLNHYKLNCALSKNEVDNIPPNILSDILIQKISTSFEDMLTQKTIPIDTYYDEQFGQYKVTVDLWVKPFNY